MRKVLWQTKIVGLDSSFDIVDPSRVLFETNKRIVYFVVVDPFSGGKPAVGGLGRRGGLPGFLSSLPW